MPLFVKLPGESAPRGNRRKAGRARRRLSHGRPARRAEPEDNALRRTDARGRARRRKGRSTARRTILASTTAGASSRLSRPGRPSTSMLRKTSSTTTARTPGRRTISRRRCPAGFRALRNALLAMDRPTAAAGDDRSGEAQEARRARVHRNERRAGRRLESPEPAGPHRRDRRDEGRRRASHTRGIDAGVSALRALLKRNPKMSDAWAQLATMLHEGGRDREALAALREVDRLNPGSPFVLISFANMCLEMGDLAEAKSFAEKAVAAADTPATHVTLAHVLFVAKDLDGAEAEANAALRGNEGRRLPRVVLALVKKARGDLPGSLALLDSVKGGEGVPPMSGVEFQRGDVLVPNGPIRGCRGGLSRGNPRLSRVARRVARARGAAARREPARRVAPGSGRDGEVEGKPPGGRRGERNATDAFRRRPMKRRAAASVAILAALLESSAGCRRESRPALGHPHFDRHAPRRSPARLRVRQGRDPRDRRACAAIRCSSPRRTAMSR